MCLGGIKLLGTELSLTSSDIEEDVECENEFYRM